MNKIRNNCISKKSIIKSYVVIGSLAAFSVSPLASADPTLVADTYVKVGQAKSFGTKTALLVGTGKSVFNTYLKFDLNKSKPDGDIAVSKAILKVFVTGIKAKSTGKIHIHALPLDGSGTNWTDLSGVLPGFSAATSLDVAPPDNTPLTANQWVEFDVTSYMQDAIDAGVTQIGFALSTDGTLNIKLESKESKASGHSAVLNVVYATAGIAGAQGVKGDKGDTGLTGPQGLVGPQGIQGLVGPQGLIGPQGLLGPQGLIGPQGLLGPQGLIGPQGLQGLTGPQGLQGLTGLTGPQGLQGLTGPQGPQGVAGQVANTVVKTVTNAAPIAGQVLNAACDPGQILVGGGILTPPDVTNVLPLINAPVLDPVTNLPIGWQAAFGLLNTQVTGNLVSGTVNIIGDLLNALTGTLSNTALTGQVGGIVNNVAQNVVLPTAANVPYTVYAVCGQPAA